jgi:hypothetical protein
VSRADQELRLECARLVAVFTNGKGDMVALTDRLFRYIKEGGE